MSIAAMATRLGVFAVVLLFSGAAYAADNLCDKAAVNPCDHAGLSANNSAPSCSTVSSDLTPCLTFIKGSEDKPSNKCCSGAKMLNDIAKTKADRRAICECIKKAMKLIGKVDTSRIPLLVKDCGLSIKLPPIGSNTDCSKVTFYEG